MYLYSPEAPYRIRYYVPEAKLITNLRNPVERAYSAFLYMTRDGREPLSEFSQALRAEERRIRDNWEWIWHYRHLGYYYTQLKRYFDVFDRNQIKVYLYEDLRASLPRVVQDIFRFLEVDESFVPDTSLRHNVSGTPRNGLLPRLIYRRNPIKAVLRPLFPQALRQRISANLRSQYLVEAPGEPIIFASRTGIDEAATTFEYGKFTTLATGTRGILRVRLRARRAALGHPRDADELVAGPDLVRLSITAGARG